MYPLGAGKSLSINNTNMTANDQQFIKSIEKIINLKARGHVLKDCNTTEVKILAEIIKRYRRILRNMSKNGLKRIKPKDLVREQTIAASFSISSTNQRKHQISFKNGQFLNMDRNGYIYGSSLTVANRNNSKYFNLIVAFIITIYKYLNTITSQPDPN